jgi:hypothetical protein
MTQQLKHVIANTEIGSSSNTNNKFQQVKINAKPNDHIMFDA